MPCMRKLFSGAQRARTSAKEIYVLLHLSSVQLLTLAQRATHSLLYVLPSEPHSGLSSFVQTHPPAVSMGFVFHGVSSAVSLGM